MMKSVFILRTLDRHEPTTFLGAASTLGELVRYIEANKKDFAHSLSADPNTDGWGLRIEKVVLGVLGYSALSVAQYYNWEGTHVKGYDDIGREI